MYRACGLQAAGILAGSLDGARRQGAQGKLPVFADRGLANSSNDDISHRRPRYFIAILPRKRT